MTTARIKRAGTQYAAMIDGETYKFCDTPAEARRVIIRELERKVDRAGLMTPMLAALVKADRRN